MESFHAKTLKGLENVLADELRELGAENVEPVNRGVNFSGGRALLYKANFCLRTALRILMPITRFTAYNDKRLYSAIYGIDWSQYLNVKKSFAIDAVVFSRVFTHSLYLEQKIKDAIVDQFMENSSLRPSVNTKNPDVRINVHVTETSFLVSLDSSGESLHKRGYKTANHIAAINEVLAAGMIMLTGWKGEKPFLDPMCGSGTIPIEAALIAGNIPPGVFRKKFAFEDWLDFDPVLYERVIENLPESREIKVPIHASDHDMESVRQAKINVRYAKLDDVITIGKQDLMEYPEQEEEWMMIMNPPYGERIQVAEIEKLYNDIGSTLKHKFGGSKAWIFTSNFQALKHVGLKPDKKIILFNANLECKYVAYSMFKGKRKDYKSHSI